MKKIHLDGEVQYEVPEPVAQHIDGLNAKVASIAQIQADKADAEAKLAAANAALATVNADASDLKASIPQKIADGVRDQLALVAKVQGLGVAVKSEDSADEIRKAAIKEAMPKVTLDGMDEVQIAAHFDAACALLTERKDPVVSQRLSVADGVPSKTPSIQADSAEGRMADAWKSK